MHPLTLARDKSTDNLYFYLDDSKLLNKLCDDVINMEISVEELLEEDEHLVSSTDVTPVKLIPPTKRKGSASSRVLKMSKQLKEAEILSEVANVTSIQSASKRAYQLFGKTSKVKRVKADKPVSSDSEDDDLELASKGRKKSKQATVETSESEDESDSPTSGKSAELRRALNEISQLKKQLEETVKSGKLIHYAGFISGGPGGALPPLNLDTRPLPPLE